MNVQAFDLFRHNVMCRSDSNQRKARSMWDNLIKSQLTTQSRNQFSIAWAHYLMGETTPNEFGITVKELGVSSGLSGFD